MWDVAEYQKFSDERSRPFADLLTQVRRAECRFIADLGCGAGNLTLTLAKRWPSAHVVGIDTSTEMLAQAVRLAIPDRSVSLRRGDEDGLCYRTAQESDSLAASLAGKPGLVDSFARHESGPLLQKKCKRPDRPVRHARRTLDLRPVSWRIQGK